MLQILKNLHVKLTSSMLEFAVYEHYQASLVAISRYNNCKQPAPNKSNLGITATYDHQQIQEPL